MHDIGEDFFFCNPKVWVIIFRMGAYVNDAIHVKVEIVKLWNLKHTILTYSLGIHSHQSVF